MPVCCRASGVTPDDARRLALDLPDVVERDHHGFPSFRAGARGRIFATLPTAEVLRVMLDEESIREAVARVALVPRGLVGEDARDRRGVLADADPGA